MIQRALIFDSLQKIVTTIPQKTNAKDKEKPKDNRGTYVFTWGAGYAGQLGRKFIRGQKKYSALPLPIDLDDVVKKTGVAIRQVSCGGLHTAVVTENGQVYTWGDGRKGELGHIHDPSLKQTPRLVENLENVFIKQVACGRGHTVALTDTGKVYSWGWGKFGQTGHGHRSTLKTPKQIDHALVKDITTLACGNKHTMLVNKAGQVISFGCNEHGQTGHPQTSNHTGRGQSNDCIIHPTLVEALQNEGVVAVSVACGAIHTCIVTQDGDVYLCGFGEHMHPSESQHFNYTPTKLTLPEPVLQVACGQAHNVALTQSGNVYSWGAGDYGQIGHGIRGNTAIPKLVLDKGDISQVAAGRYHSFALSNAGILWSWGCGENGQLGGNSDENVYLPKVVTAILGTVVGQVSCGEHHTAVLTGAPWSSVSQDVAEQHMLYKAEYAMKEEYVKKSHRGLTKKDLNKIAEEMVRWIALTADRKKQMLSAEEEELNKEVSSIMFTGPLQDCVDDRIDDLTKVDNFLTATNNLAQTGALVETDTVNPFAATSVKELEPISQQHPALKLPHIQGQYYNQGNGGANAYAANNNKGELVLPPIAGKKTAGQTSRVGSGNPANNQTMVSGGVSGAIGTQQARAAFLKETANMVKDMAATVMGKGESVHSRHLNKLMRQVFDIRREYDNVKHESKVKGDEYARLNSEYELLVQQEKGVNAMYEQLTNRLKEIEMRLKTVTIKISETAENRQNYQTNIVHLKEEDFDNFNQLKTLRKQTQDNNAFFRKLNDMRQGANTDKEKAEAELNEFKNEIKQYQAFVHEQFSQFENILHVMRVQQEKREKAKQEVVERSRQRLSTKVEKLHEDAKQTDEEYQALQTKLNALELKLRHFEDSFTKVAAATGLTDPDAIVNKYFFKSEIKQQLQQEIDEKEKYKQELKTRENELKKHHHDMVQNSKNHTWKDVDVKDDQVREKHAKSKKAQNDQVLTAQRLAFIQEGVLALSKGISAVTLQNPDSYGYNGDAGATTVASLHDAPEDGEEQASGLWTPDVADRILTKIHVDLDVLLEAEKEVNTRAQVEVGPDGTVLMEADANTLPMAAMR